MRRRAAPVVSGIGRFPYTETTGGLAEIAVGADGARILPEPQESGQKTRYFAPCDPLLTRGRRLDEGPPDQERRQGANSRPCDLGFRSLDANAGPAGLRYRLFWTGNDGGRLSACGFACEGCPGLGGAVQTSPRGLSRS